MQVKKRSPVVTYASYEKEVAKQLMSTQYFASSSVTSTESSRFQVGISKSQNAGKQSSCQNSRSLRASKLRKSLSTHSSNPSRRTPPGS